QTIENPSPCARLPPLQRTELGPEKRKRHRRGIGAFLYKGIKITQVRFVRTRPRRRRAGLRGRAPRQRRAEHPGAEAPSGNVELRHANLQVVSQYRSSVAASLEGRVTEPRA